MAPTSWLAVLIVGVLSLTQLQLLVVEAHDGGASGPSKCGPNQHFALKASPCQRTCDDHFFGTAAVAAKKLCRKLAKVDGCRCNRGFVLDADGRCVRPKQCGCLAKLCVDRVPRSKCRRWRAQGRCRKFADVMGRYCRLTCRHCRPRCQNQLSDKVCRRMRRNGKCRRLFYRTVCRATCSPHKCRCPSNRRVKSKCSKRLKNRSVTSLKWFPVGASGKCKKSVIVRYEPCGSCKHKAKTVWKPCNYCKGYQVGERIVQYREPHGKHRCLRRARKLHRRCKCSRKIVKRVKCERNTLRVRIVKAYKPGKKCSACVRSTRRTVLKRIDCSGRRVVAGKCKSKSQRYRTVRVYRKYASSCACKWRRVRTRKVPCRCKPTSSKTHCRGNRLVTVTTGWRLKGDRCRRWTRRTERKPPCAKRRRRWLKCHRKTCRGVRHTSQYQLKRCKCVKKTAKKHIGKCCCPHGYKRKVRIDRYWKKLIRVSYALADHKCHKRTSTRKFRVACPKPSRTSKCHSRRGVKVFKRVWYVLKDGHCVKRTTKRVARIHCRRSIKRRVGPCNIRIGASRYRKVKFEYYHRRQKSCQCVRLRRTVKELCHCPRGSFVKTSRCPKTGCSGVGAKSCGSHCHFTKTYYYYYAKRRAGRRKPSCHRQVFRRLRFPCCCDPKKRVKRWCRSGKYVMRRVSYTVLKRRKHSRRRACHRMRRTTSTRVWCKYGPDYFEQKKLPHPKSDHYYLATYRWHVRKCRCVAKVSKRVCLKRCQASKRRRYCDRVRRHWVTRRVTWHLRGCRTCVRRVKVHRVPVKCSQAVKRTKRCNHKTGVLTVTITRWRRKGCQCLRRRTERHLRCKCPKPVVGKARCNRHRRAFVRRVTYWVLKSGKCIKRHRKKIAPVKCGRSVKYRSVCKAKSGVKIVYIGVLRVKGCKCVRRWTVHDRLRCNCKRENRHRSRHSRRYCDRLRNLKVTVTYHYVLRKGRCVRRSRSRSRGYRCPKPYHERRPCDEKRRVQVTLKHYSVKKHCRCVRVVQRRRRKCGCPGRKIVRRRECRKAQGLVVHSTISRRWNNKKHQCVKKIKKRSHRVSCSRKTSYRVSRCIKNDVYVETKIFHIRKGCRCVRQRIKRKKNCHCKPIVRHYKCPPHGSGYFRRVVTQIRRWDSATKRCRTVRHRTRRIRCRCPAGRKRRYCRHGAWITEVTGFALDHGSCYKHLETRERHVVCEKATRRRYTACKGCRRYIYTLEKRLDSKRCACYFAVVKRKACPCCCRKPITKRRCIKGGKAWQRVTIGYKALGGKQCGCKRWQIKRTTRVKCSKRRRLSWLRCNKRICVSRQRVKYYATHACKCRRVSRLTGKQRTCCCKEKPRRRRICRKGAIYVQIIDKRLKKWRCVRRKRLRMLRKWRCRAKPKVVVGECDHSNCKQPIHTLVSRVDHPHCRCRRVAIKRHHRPCCCQKPPQLIKRCDSATGHLVTTRITFVFDEDRHTCIACRDTKRTPIRCRRKTRRIVGSCNRSTCQRIVKHVSYYAKHCQCKRRVRRSSHICCCPPAKRLPPRCLTDWDEWQWRHVSWRMIHGRCIKRVTTTQRQATCLREATTRVGACSRKTCRQRVVHTRWYLKACRCVARKRTTERTCCCRPAKRSVTKCEGHRTLVRYTTLRKLDWDRSCQSHTMKTKLHHVDRCRNYLKVGRCNPKTRHRIIRRSLRRPKNCRCRVYRRVVRRVLCSCPKTRVKRTKCNKASCHRSITKIWYTSYGKGPHFRCRKHRRTIRLRCCCQRNPTKRVFCHQPSGAIKREDQWTVFVSHSRTCRRRRSIRVVKQLTCRRKTCRVSKCNKRTGYKVRVCVSFKPNRKGCNCLRRIARRKIACHCPRGRTQVYCKDHGSLIKIRTTWRLSYRRNRCLKTVRRRVRRIACSHRRWRVKKCSKSSGSCNGAIYYYHYRRRNCRCRRVTRVQRIKCCCPKSIRRKRCLGDEWQTMHAWFKLLNGRCIRHIQRKEVSVSCRTVRIRIGKCEKDCRKRKVILHYDVKNCKCTRIRRIVHTKRCCCPKARRYMRCNSAKGIIMRVHEFWRLDKGKCFKRRRVSSKRVRCHVGWSKAFKCNKVTRLQKVVLVKFLRVGCKCRRHRRVRHHLCRCRPSRVVKEKCTHLRRKRRVYKITYTLVHPRSKLARCQKRRRLWYTEPCRCPKPGRRKFCSHSGKTLVTVSWSWKLVISKRRHWHHHQGQQHACLRKKSVWHRNIRCAKRKVRWSKCSGFHKKRTVITYWVHRCKCSKHIHIRTFACNCAKKSYSRRRCNAKSGHLVFTKRVCFARRGARKCSCRTRRWKRPVLCSRRHHRVRLTKKHCGLLRRHGWYNRYLIKWTRRRACGCVRRRRTVLRFCHCRRGVKRVRCSVDGKTVVKTHISYKRNKKHHYLGCRRIKRVSRRRIFCPRGGKPKVRFGGCGHRCKRSVTLSQCYVKQCRRHRYVRSGLQLCCAPKPKRKRYCERKKGKWVHKIIKYRLVPSKPLIKDRHGNVAAPQLKVVAKTWYRYRKVRCPRGSTRETCHRRTGRWTKIRVHWRRVGCHCRRRVTRSHGKCKCPPKRIHWGPCRKRKRVKTIIYFVLRSHSCRRQVKRRSYLCACPKRRRYTVCDKHRGAWKTCWITYRLKFRQQRCLRRRVCRHRHHTCPAKVERRGKCIAFKRWIWCTSWRLNRRKCACIKRVRKRAADCNCHKKHHKSTVCRHGAFVTRIFTYHQRGERCVKAVRTIKRPVYCRGRHIKRLIRHSCIKKAGHPRRGYQKLMTERSVRRGCKCIRKRVYRWVPCICRLIKRYRWHKSARCRRHGSLMVHAKIYYVLKRGFKCVKRVLKRNRKVVCTGVKVRRSPCRSNRHGDKYATKRVWHRRLDGRCGCKWHLVTVKHRICKCRRSKKVKRCVHHKIRRHIHITYVPLRGKSHCGARRRIRDKKISCRKGFSRRSKCHKCVFSVHRYAYRPEKCRCVARVVKVHRHLRCCCPSPTTKRICDAKRHLRVKVTTVYKLHRYRCHRRRITRSRRVRCGRIRPFYRVTKCHKGFRTIRKTIRYTAACVCRVRTSVHKQRCACPYTLTLRRGKCGRRFAHDAWLSYQLKPTGRTIPGTNKPVMKCVRVAVDRRKRRCRCPKPSRRSVCRAHNRLFHVTVSYHLRGNSCQRKQTVHKRRLSCNLKPRLVRVVVSPSKCSSKHGYRQTVSKIYTQAVRCRCRRIVRKTRRICSCLHKYGGKKRHVKCLGSRRLVKRVVWMEKSRSHRGRHRIKCVRRVKTSVKILHCPKKLRVRAGKCSQNAPWLQSYRIYRLVARRCRCVWTLFRRTRAPCRCRKSVHAKRCHGNKAWVTMKHSWHLVGRGPKKHCIMRKHRIVSRVKCGVGRKVSHSRRCDRRGYRHTKITINRVHRCRCLKRLERHRCRCRCPKDRVKRVCSNGGRVWTTLRISHKIVKCACRSARKVIRAAVVCPKAKRVRGHCRPSRHGHGADKYRRLVHTTWRVHKCRCVRKQAVRRRLCGCDRRRRKRVGCVSGSVRFMVITERRVVSGRCRRIPVLRRSILVRCRREQVRRVCHRKSGLLSVFVVKNYVKNCRCYRRVQRHIRHCGCHGGPKLLGVGKCNRRSCRQRLFFKKQVVDRETDRCLWRRYHSHRACCCHSAKRRSVKCLRKAGYHLIKHTDLVLKHWQCVKRVSQISKKIKCKRHQSKRAIRQRGCVLKLVNCWVVRRGCDCVKRCRTTLSRYCCKKTSKRVTCQCSGGKCRRVAHITKWRLSGGRCYPQTRTRALPTVCPVGRLVHSRCDLPTKYGFYYARRETVWYQKACRCHRRSRVTRVTCRCWKPRVLRRCHRRRGIVETTKIHYRLRRGRCVKSMLRKARKVRCKGGWRYEHKTKPNARKHGLFFKVYSRWARSGCRCLKKHKRVPCYSRCRPCHTRKRCSRSHDKKHQQYLISIRTCWRLAGCRCIRRVVTRRRAIRCPKSFRRTRCHGRRGGCVLSVTTRHYRVRACRCHAITRVSKARRCCCPKPRRTHKCVKGGLVRLTRLVTYHLRNGRCRKRVRESHRQVKCPKKRRRAIQGRCRNGKQRYSLHYWVTNRCRCVKRVRTHYRLCAACQHKIVELTVAVDLHATGGRKERRMYRSSVAGFLDTVLRHFKFAASKFRTTLFAFNSGVKRRHHRSVGSIKLVEFTGRKTDLHGALRAINAKLSRRRKHHSRVDRIVVIVTRGNHYRRRRTLVLADRIKRRAEVFVVGFGSLPKSGRYVKWLASRPQGMHFMRLGMQRRHKFSATRLFEFACRRRCAKRSHRRVGACRRDTCRRPIVHVSWHADHRTGKCLRRRRTSWQACCCLHRNTNRVKCNRRGRLIRVLVSHRFDSRRHTCQRRVRRIDVSARLRALCRPGSNRIRGACGRDGWRRDVLTTRRIDRRTCRCRKTRRRLRPIRCRCPPSRRLRHTCRRKRRHGQWFRVECVIAYRLVRRGHRRSCVKHRRCVRHRIKCPGAGHRKRSAFKGRCNRHSCRRRRDIVWYKFDGKKCRCKRHVKTWKEVCCCKRRSRKYSFCDKRRHKLVRVHTWHRLRDGACRRVTRRRERPVACRSRRKLKPGKCSVHRGLGVYRRVVRVTWHLRGCRCVRRLHNAGLHLCRCRHRVRTVKRCRHQSGVQVTRRGRLVKQGEHCRWRWRVARRVHVTCSARRRVRRGRCRLVGKHKKRKGQKGAAGRWVAKVTVTWQRRVGCKCRTIRRQHNRVCACSKRVRRATRCHRNRWLMVSVYRYRLARKGRQGAAACVLVRKTHRRRVSCHRPLVRTGKKCRSGKRSVVVTVHRARACRCVAKTYRHLVGCKPRCRDQLPTKICRKWAASPRVRLCRRHPHYAHRLCARTCGHCCHKTTISYAGKRCLSHQKKGTFSSHLHGGGLVLGKLHSFEACAHACGRNPRCHAFDYSRARSTCRLLRWSRHELLSKLPKLSLHRTPGCMLFEKACPGKSSHPRPTCPFRRIVKALPCRCRALLGKGRKSLCYRRAVVAVYHRRRHRRHGRKGSTGCHRRLIKLRLSCRRCDDTKGWCRSAARKGRCVKSAKVRRLCPHSCRQCKRHRRHHRHPRRSRPHVGRCSKTGWRRVVRSGLWFDRRLWLWRVRVSVSRKRCVRCAVGSYLLIGRCSKKRGSKRRLRWVTVKRLPSGRCKSRLRTRVFDCRGCGGLDLARSVGRCTRAKKASGGWLRRVVTRYTVRDKRHHHGRCVIRRHVQHFACSPKCPKRRVRRSRCVCGKRIVCTRYYVTYPESGEKHRCVPKKYTKTVACVGSAKACTDKLRPSDCAAIKRTGMCKSLGRMCAKTCGRCK